MACLWLVAFFVSILLMLNCGPGFFIGIDAAFLNFKLY
jgi:hypothetical protein